MVILILGMIARFRASVSVVENPPIPVERGRRSKSFSSSGTMGVRWADVHGQPSSALLLSRRHRGTGARRRRHQAAQPTAAGRETTPRTMGTQRAAQRATLIFLSTVLLAGHRPPPSAARWVFHRAGPWPQPRTHAFFASADHRNPDAGVDARGRGPASGSATSSAKSLALPIKHHHGPDGHSGRHLRRRPQPQYLSDMSIALKPYHALLRQPHACSKMSPPARLSPKGSLTRAESAANGTGQKAPCCGPFAGLGNDRLRRDVGRSAGPPRWRRLHAPRAVPRPWGFVHPPTRSVSPNLACEDVRGAGDAPPTPTGIGRMQEADRAPSVETLAPAWWGCRPSPARTMGPHVRRRSGQRVMIAPRGWPRTTPVILLDEPTAFPRPPETATSWRRCSGG